jgi:hypothetical protein
VTFHNKLIFYTEFLANTLAGGPPLVGCPRLLIQYIRSYPPYLEVVSSICNLRTRHAMVTRDPHNMAGSYISVQISCTRAYEWITGKNRVSGLQNETAPSSPIYPIPNTISTTNRKETISVREREI